MHSTPNGGPEYAHPAYFFVYPWARLCRLKKLKAYLLFLLVFCTAFLRAQEGPPLSNLRDRVFAVQSDSLLLDTLTVFPGTVEVWLPDGNALQPNAFRIADNRLLWTARPLADSVRVRFRVLPYALGSPAEKPISATFTGGGANDTTVFYRPNQTALAKMEFRGLDYSGSFERGISFGNNQSLVVNSSFNLQLAGKLSDDLEISAALTDANIPLQAAGNTAQLQELDRIFIQLKRKKTVLTAGDYELKRPPESFFLQYLKKAQGATLQTEALLPGGGSLRFDGSLAVSRGKFGRNVFPGREGNQGPYRLTGNDGETFIIILSGTERVYIDGNLLQRGQDKDYVIDYNSGELTFTANRLITKDIRIQVEFGYAAQNYVRSMYAVNAAWRQARWGFHAHLFSEQDGRNQPSFFSLTDEDRRILSDAGDNPLLAVRPAFDTLPQGFDPNRIQYKLIDTLVGGVSYDSVLVYSTDPAVARYVAGFASVGPGMGDYRLKQSSANGRVYEWVAPDPNTGARSGDHAPILRLVSPKRLQVFAFGGETPIGKEGQLKAELALSRNDLNTFSARDADDDNGLAVRLGYRDRFVFLKKKNPANDSLSRVVDAAIEVHYEGVQQYFQWVEPYRRREFQRDWNTDALAVRTEEHLASVSMQLRDTRFGALRYEVGGLLKDSLYRGLRQTAQLDFKASGFRALLNASLTQSEGSGEKTTFWRPNFTLTHTVSRWKNFTTGFYWEREENQRRDLATDTFRLGAFRWDILRAWVELPATDSSLYVRLGGQYRRDYSADSNLLALNSTARELALTGGWALPKSKARLQWNLTWRDLAVLDSLLLSTRSQDTWLGRVEYSQAFGRGAVRASTVYQLGTGQQRQTDYVFLRVNPGEGVYAWLDRNQDSIPQLNEFEISPFPDQAAYLRITQFTDRFVRTADLVFSQSLHLTPKLLWPKAKKGSAKHFLNRFSSISLYRLERRALARTFAFNPFENQLPDSLLVSVQSDLRNTLFFNRTHPKYGLELAHTASRNRATPVSGYEERRRWEGLARLRWNFVPKASLNFLASLGENTNDAELFGDRDFRLSLWKIEPQLVYVPNKSLRFTVFFRYRRSLNTIGDNESLTGQEAGAEWAWNKAAKTDIRAKFSYARLEFLGNASSPTGFAMLEGLQGGNNYLWSLNLRRFLNSFLEVSIGYDGRKTGLARMVHTGRVQVRASF